MTECLNKENDTDSDSSSKFYDTTSLPDQNVKTIGETNDKDIHIIDISNIPPPETQYDTELSKDIDELSLSSDHSLHCSDEETYELNKEFVEGIPNFILNSSGRVYSTIMEEPEDDSSNIPYIDNSVRSNIIEVQHSNTDVMKHRNDEINCLEVFDCLLTPPPESDLWRMSGTSCLTGVSSTTDLSDDTVAQNMSELSSVNSYLSDFANKQNESNKNGQCAGECEDLSETTPKVSPMIERKRKKKNISDAISQLEDIEQAAQNLLRTNKYTNILKSGKKPEVSGLENNQAKVRTDKNGSAKNYPQKRRKKSSKSHEQEKNKKPVYWLKPDHIKPYISRESYNEELTDVTDASLSKSFQEGDLNDFLDELETDNEIRDRNGCLSDENFSTLEEINISKKNMNDQIKSNERQRKKESKSKICTSSKKDLLKDIDCILEISELDKVNNNPNSFKAFEKMENSINKNRNVSNKNQVIEDYTPNNEHNIRHISKNSLNDDSNIQNNNLLSNMGDLKINCETKKSQKIKKKGSKSKKPKKLDKPAVKPDDSLLDSCCSTSTKIKMIDSFNKNEISIQPSVSDSLLSPTSNKFQKNNIKETGMVPKQSLSDEHVTTKNDKVCQIRNKRNENKLNTIESNFNNVGENGIEKQFNTTITIEELDKLWFNDTPKDSYKDLADKSEQIHQNTRETNIALEDNLKKSENDLIADISNNLWNNYSFEEDNCFLPDRIEQLPNIPEASSDDYSIPQTPEITSIYVNSEHPNKIYNPSVSFDKNEATLLDSESICQIRDENETNVVNNANLVSVKRLVNKYENPCFDTHHHSNDTTDQLNKDIHSLNSDSNLISNMRVDNFAKTDDSNLIISNERQYAIKTEHSNLDTYWNNKNSKLNSSNNNNFTSKIEYLSYYSDEMLKITEAMEKEYKSSEFSNNIKNKGEQLKPATLSEYKKCDAISYPSPPVRNMLKSELNKSIAGASKDVTIVPIKSKLNLNHFHEKDPQSMVPNESPFSAPPIIYKSKSPDRRYFSKDEDEKVALGVPIHYKQKMPPMVVSELKNMLKNEHSKEKQRQSLKDVYKKFDLALAGIDEPSLLEEIQQLLGFDVRQKQNEIETPVTKVEDNENIKKVLSSKQIITSFKSDKTETHHAQNKIPPPPPKRTPIKSADIQELTNRYQLSPTFESNRNNQPTPPVPPRPQYKETDKESVEVKSYPKVHNLGIPTGGVWSPGSAPVDHSGPTKLDNSDLPSFRDVPPVWNPVARGGSASPGINKEYRKITFDGPTVPKRAHQQENREVPKPEESFAWQGKRTELRSESHLPRAPNPTVTLLQKKREGLIQDHKPDYILPDEHSYYKPGDKLYTIKKEYESEDEERRKFAVLGPRKIEGVGPITKEGMPISLKSGVKSEHHGEWYKRMFDSIHKVKDESNTRQATKVRYGGYMSEPEGYDSDTGVTRYAKYDRSKNEFEYENTESNVGRKTKRYVHQPGRIENYVPGFSSLSERELRENPEADVKLELSAPRPSRQTFQGVRRLGSGYKESGYDSDSTLVFKKREDTRRDIIDPSKNTEIYREIQRGGEIPLSGLRRPAPRPKAQNHNKYETSEVNIHYRTPIRVERKEVISDDELARRQEEHMKKVYEQERRKKYLSELDDIERRRHTDNFTPLQKSPIPLNRYDDEIYGGIRAFKTPEPRQLAKALFGFQAQNKRELNFSKGDIITIRRHIDKNWMEGELKTNVGIFPSNYVEVLPFDNYKTAIRRSTEGQARVRFNFQAQTSMEMSLNKGEIIVLTRRVDDNWFEGRIGLRKGIFPVAYVDVIQEPVGRDTSPVLDTLSRPALPPAHLLFNGTSSVNSPYSTLGHHGNQTDNKVPFSQLSVNTQQEPISYRALYNYKPQNDDELELLEGDAVMVMEKCDDGWFVGTSQRTNSFGTFPGNYVEKM